MGRRERLILAGALAVAAVAVGIAYRRRQELDARREAELERWRAGVAALTAERRPFRASRLGLLISGGAAAASAAVACAPLAPPFGSIGCGLAAGALGAWGSYDSQRAGHRAGGAS